MSSPLPTDEEFLQQLYEDYKDKRLLDRFSRSAQAFGPAYIEAGVEDLLSRPELEYVGRDRLRGYVREALSPSLLFNGAYVRLLKEHGQEVLSPQHAHLASIPVGILPTENFNACAVQTPRGGVVLLLDYGIMVVGGRMIDLYLSFWTRHAPHPFCRDHPQASFAHALVLLAKYCASSDQKYLDQAFSLTFNPDPQFRNRKEHIRVVMMLWILFHEYGHAALNHFTADDVSEIRFPWGPRLNAYNSSQTKEFEADRFAFDEFLKHSTSRERFLNDLFPFGLLLNFFALCDTVRGHSIPRENATHPPAAERWGKISEFGRVSKDPIVEASDLENVFAAVRHVTGIE